MQSKIKEYLLSYKQNERATLITNEPQPTKNTKEGRIVKKIPRLDEREANDREPCQIKKAHQQKTLNHEAVNILHD